MPGLVGSFRAKAAGKDLIVCYSCPTKGSTEELEQVLVDSIQTMGSCLEESILEGLLALDWLA